MARYEDLTIFSGNANRGLAEAVAEHLQVSLGNLEVFEFSNENIFVKIDESVRENDVYIVQSPATPVNRSIIEKRRAGNADRSQVLNLIGEVDGRTAVLVDDEIDTGGSITQAAMTVMDRGAKEVYACCVHPVLSGPAVERLAEGPIRELVTTDTIPIPPEKWIDKFTVLSVASILAETVWRIHTGASGGALCEASRP